MTVKKTHENEEDSAEKRLWQADHQTTNQNARLIQLPIEGLSKRDFVTLM